jgi:creatinine amidohydrolase
MRIAEMNWMMVEEYLRRDDRCVLPIGSTEQHAYLSLSVDSILAERLANDAAEPLGVPVFPVLAYGITPYFRAFPGTISLRVQTHLSIVRDILDSMQEQGFKRILIVNGHGGNVPAQGLVAEWLADHPGMRISSTIGGTRQRCGPASRRSIRSRLTRRGWKIFRGPGWRRLSCPRNKSR